MADAFTMLLTGLSGAGKTTNAKMIVTELQNRGIQVELLDGDVVRDEIGNLFGYTREERNKVSKIHRFLAKMLNRNGISVIVAAISPYEEMRESYRNEIKNYVEVYVECPIEVCIERDVKGIYQKAIRGEMKHVIGIDESFEVPQNPDIVVNTSAATTEENMIQIIEALKEKQFA